MRPSQTTGRYDKVLAQIPSVFVGSSDLLSAIVRLIGQEIASVFDDLGMTLPPWRRVKSLLSRWHPERFRDRHTFAVQASPVGSPPTDGGALPVSVSMLPLPLPRLDFQSPSAVQGISSDLRGMTLAEAAANPWPNVEESESEEEENGPGSWRRRSSTSVSRFSVEEIPSTKSRRPSSRFAPSAESPVPSDQLSEFQHTPAGQRKPPPEWS